VTTIFAKKAKRNLRVDERPRNFKSGLDGHLWAEIAERLSALRARELWGLISRLLRTILDFHLDLADQVSALKEEN